MTVTEKGVEVAKVGTEKREVAMGYKGEFLKTLKWRGDKVGEVGGRNSWWRR